MVTAMPKVRFHTRLAAAFAVALFSLGAHAQFSGLVTLPSSDFTWRWGNWDRELSRRVNDFDITGHEASFRCELTAGLRPSSRMTREDVRAIENELQGSLYFIQEAAHTLNILDQQRDLEWAELACAKPQPAETSPEESQERVDRAREKAVEEMLRQRERRERREREN